MKVAIVHDSLTEFGGAERVLQSLLDLYPTADVYTAFIGSQFRQTYLPSVSPDRIHVSWIQPLHLEHHTSLVQAIAPAVWGSFHLTGYDLVITHCLHLMSSLVTVPPNTTHITYIQSPPKNVIGFEPPTPLQRLVPYTPIILGIYKRALSRLPYIITNSRHSREVLFTHIGIDSHVIYPPVSVHHPAPRHSPGSYYLSVSRLDRGKNIELSVIAATRLNLPLLIVGETNEPRYEAYLKSIAGPTVQFLGRRTDTEVKRLYAGAIAFLFTALKEDFGIAPLEALGYGVPVISYYGGGPKETLIDGKTGLFFRTHTPESLMGAIRKLKQLHFSPHALHAHAQKFAPSVFRARFRSYVTTAMHEQAKAR